MYTEELGSSSSGKSPKTGSFINYPGWRRKEPRFHPAPESPLKLALLIICIEDGDLKSLSSVQLLKAP
jgi:hypothetical protein